MAAATRLVLALKPDWPSRSPNAAEFLLLPFLQQADILSKAVGHIHICCIRALSHTRTVDVSRNAAHYERATHLNPPWVSVSGMCCMSESEGLSQHMDSNWCSSLLNHYFLILSPKVPHFKM